MRDFFLGWLIGLSANDEKSDSSDIKLSDKDVHGILSGINKFLVILLVSMLMMTILNTINYILIQLGYL